MERPSDPSEHIERFSERLSLHVNKSQCLPLQWRSVTFKLRSDRKRIGRIHRRFSGDAEAGRICVACDGSLSLSAMSLRHGMPAFDPRPREKLGLLVYMYILRRLFFKFKKKLRGITDRITERPLPVY